MSDRRGQDEFARHRGADERRHLDALRRQFGPDRGRRQQRVAEALLHQADLGAVGIGFDQWLELQSLAGDGLLQQCAQAVRDAGKDQFLLHQPFQVDLLPPVQPRPRRPHHGDVLASDRLNLKMQIHRRSIGDRKVHFTPVQPLDQVPAVALHDAQRDVGKIRDHAAGKSPGKNRAHGRHQAEDDAAGRIAVRRLKVVANLLDLAHQARWCGRAACGRRWSAACRVRCGRTARREARARAA